jgi:glycosyltransferase involved in cell wall biosynthesis
MRAGLPVIATDVDGVREAVTDGDNGLLVRARDLDGLVDAIRLLIADPALRERMGERGRLAYEERFSVSGMLRKTRTIYENTLRGTAPLETVPTTAHPVPDSTLVSSLTQQ